MKKINVLVTGVGAIIGYGIITSLRKSDLETYIIGTDIYDDAIGRGHCDEFVQNVLASDDEYVNHTLNICKKFNVDIIIPGIEQDLFALSKNRQIFIDNNITLAINDVELINLCKDKWNFFNGVVDSRCFLIDSYTDDFERCRKEFGLPFLLKPKRSYASKGICKIENKIDFEYWKNKIEDNFMVQPIIGDDDNEFTASAFGFGNGKVSSPIIFKRKLSGEGSTVKAELVHHEQIVIAIDKLSAEFKPVGPTNYQFRLHNGTVKLLEINPRISSATSLRTLCGYNEAEMCLKYFHLKEMFSVDAEDFDVGMKMGRYIEDYIVE